ncbi:MAG: sensor histidine kinase [Chloroflexota bacterium]
MAAEVDATRRAEQQLLADVRHDLRTPLTVISGFSEALRDGTATGPDAERAADAISAEAARLERLLDDLDQLTFGAAGGPTLRLELLDGVIIATATVARFAAHADANGQELSVASDVAAAPLMVDRDAIDRILGNIVVNALGHARAPGGSAKLEVALLAAGDAPGGGPAGWSGHSGVVLAVRDDGPGIPANSLPHVFDRFYRADPARSDPGSGLGLAIVRDLAEAMGGEAFAENPAGGGARVGVILPAVSAIGRADDTP